MKIAKNYDDINWQQCRKELFRLQFEVLKAYRTNDKEKFNKIQQAQHSLTRSFAARCLAVRKVTSNSGKDTPGIDKVVYKTKKEKFDIIKEIKDLSHYKAQPVRRVYISKSNNKLRPLGIPTMKDRIVQTLFHFAIDPIVEETTDSRSYGFRLYKE